MCYPSCSLWFDLFKQGFWTLTFLLAWDGVGLFSFRKVTPAPAGELSIPFAARCIDWHLNTLAWSRTSLGARVREECPEGGPQTNTSTTKETCWHRNVNSVEMDHEWISHTPSEMMFKGFFFLFYSSRGLTWTQHMHALATFRVLWSEHTGRG